MHLPHFQYSGVVTRLDSTDIEHFVMTLLVQTMEMSRDSLHPQDCFWSKGSIKNYELLTQLQNNLGLQTDPKLEH